MERKTGSFWGLVQVVVTLLAVHPDTHRGICEEGGLPRGGVNEQVLSLQLVGEKAVYFRSGHLKRGEICI